MSESEMQTEHAETSLANVDWLYPELLSTEGLIEILKQRYLVQSDLHTFERQKLLELYYQHAIPLPQRKYRPNRRGREMTRKQILQAKKRRKFYSDEFEPPQKKSHLDDGPAPRFTTSASLSSPVEDRLKPPPSQINFDRKTIKLGSGGKQPNSANITQIKFSDSDAIAKTNSDEKQPVLSKFTRITFADSNGEKASISSNKQITEESSVKSTRIPISCPNTHATSSKKIIRLNSSSSSSSDDSLSKPVAKTIKLIHKHLGLQASPAKSTDDMEMTTETSHKAGVTRTGDTTHGGDVDMDKSEETEIVPRKKVKIKRISFP